MRAWARSAPSLCDPRVNNTHAKLLQCVTLEGVRRHQAALQAIADANGGIRAAGTPGYDQSVQYIVGKMTAAGYDVTLERVPVHLRRAAAAAADSRRSPRPTRSGTFTGTGSATSPRP